MKIKWYLSEFHACGYVRGEIVAREINRQYPNHVVDCKSAIVFSDFCDANIMLFQRQFREENLVKLRHAQEKGIKTIYEVDDDMFSMPPEFEKPYQFYAKPEVRRNMQAYLQSADAITVTTMELAQAMSSRAPDTPVFVVPNYIDVATWLPASMARLTRRRENVVIGWLASGSHKMDAPLVSSALERVMKENDNVHLHLIGWVGDDEFPWVKDFEGRVRMEEWVDISVLPLAMMNFDIGLAPLVDNPFNRSKSNLKYLQYGVLGVPSVCSPMPCYTGTISNGADGLLAMENNEEQWYEHLSRLCKSEKCRIDMGLQAMKKVVDNYNIAENAGQWIRVFDTLRQ